MLEQADVIDKATIEKDGGDMVSHHGDKKEWLWSSMGDVLVENGSRAIEMLSWTSTHTKQDIFKNASSSCKMQNADIYAVR